MKQKFFIGDKVMVTHGVKLVFIITSIYLRYDCIKYSCDGLPYFSEGDLELYKEPKKVTLYNYIYLCGTGEICETGFGSHGYGYSHLKLLKTETKEIEIEG